MANQISDLQAKFIAFAKGMPAVAISWAQVNRDVGRVIKSLAGTNPGKPSSYMGNIRMPVYGLAYSVFLETLALIPRGTMGDLSIKLTANVHPDGHPDQVIRSYVIETNPSAVVSLEFEDTTNKVYWEERGGSNPKITPAWGPNADAILASTTISVPQKDHYLDEVERQIIWLTGPSFVRLVTGVLPRYNLGEIVPWLRLRPPLRVDLSLPHIVITSSRAAMTVGDCTPTTINIEPDPRFPYGHSIPVASISADAVDLAVYAPKTRLFEFFAQKIEPAILVSDSGGGCIKWSLAGSMGLKGIVVDLLTAQGLSGVIAIGASVDFVAAARAWIDGPCGTKLSLASASVLGTGDFGAEVRLSIDIKARYIEAALAVTKSVLPNVSWDISALGWPLDQIAGEILNHVSKDEIRKLAGTVTRIGKWELVGIPLEYLDTIGINEFSEAHAEGFAGVSAFAGIRRGKR